MTLSRWPNFDAADLPCQSRGFRAALANIWTTTPTIGTPILGSVQHPLLLGASRGLLCNEVLQTGSRTPTHSRRTCDVWGHDRNPRSRGVPVRIRPTDHGPYRWNRDEVSPGESRCDFRLLAASRWVAVRNAKELLGRP
jgi:hypothetical protein